MLNSILIFFAICLYIECVDVVYELEVKTVIFNPDGYPLPVIGVYEIGKPTDRPFPGPLIHATIGDTLNITVHNNLLERISLHFHGIHLQNQVWMDGVVGITECGIAPGTTFTYEF